MDDNNVIDLNTGKITPYMYGKEAHDEMSGGLVDDTVNIPRGEYEDLLEDSLWLRMLEEAGVNEWEGYDIALASYDAYNEVLEGEE